MMRTAIIVLCVICVSGDAQQTAEELVTEAMYAGETAKAMQCITNALQLRPDYAPAYFVRGAYMEQEGNLTNALADYDRSVEFAPHLVQGYLGRAQVRKKLGDDRGAEDDLKMAERLKKEGKDFIIEDLNRQIEKNSKDPNLLLKRAYYRLEIQKDYAQAVRDYDAYLALPGEPKNTLPFERKASAQEHLGNLEGAVETYAAAIKFYPTHRCYTARARLRIKLGDYEGALDDVEDALRLASQSRELIRLKKEIQSEIDKRKEGKRQEP